MANLDSEWELLCDYPGLLCVVSFLTKRIFLLLHKNHHYHPYCTYSHTSGRLESRGGESSLFSYTGEVNKPPDENKKSVKYLGYARGGGEGGRREG